MNDPGVVRCVYILSVNNTGDVMGKNAWSVLFFGSEGSFLS